MPRLGPQCSFFWPRTPSAVGLTAVADTKDPDRRGGSGGASRRRGAGTQVGRYPGAVSLAGAGFGEALDSPLHALGNTLIESGHVIQCLLGPVDPHHSSPSRRIAFACGMPLPPWRFSQSRASATARSSSSLIDSSSKGALRSAAATGLTMVCRNWTKPESCASGRPQSIGERAGGCRRSSLSA